MVTLSLNELVRFSLGKNTTRIKEENTDLYTPEDFDKDLSCQNNEINNRECIINLMKSKAAPISIENSQKVITQNFLRCEFDEKQLDPWFFCYQFNEGKKIEQQIAMFHQGTTLSVKKLNVKSIGELKIDLPDLSKQKIIGNIYKQSILQHRRMTQQADDVMRYTMEIIRMIEED